MDLRQSLFALSARHGLSDPQAQRLHQLAGLFDEPPGLQRWLPRAVAVLAAALGGLGLIMWVAANWGGLGRVERFALLQGLVLVMGVAAALQPAARAPLALLALLGIGALFAYVGQTYQTGADAWQLFALWAALALPLALAVRSDLLWAPWSLVAMLGISLWTQTHTGRSWRVEPGDLAVHLMAFGAMLALALLLSPLLRRFTGAGLWALRCVATLAVTALTLAAVAGLFHRQVAPQYGLGLALLALAAGLLATRRGFDVFALSAVALGLNGLLLAGLTRLLFNERQPGEPILQMLLLGLVAAGLLAGSVSLILRLNKQHSGVAA